MGGRPNPPVGAATGDAFQAVSRGTLAGPAGVRPDVPGGPTGATQSATGAPAEAEACPSCGSRTRVPSYEKDGYRYLACRCGLVHLEHLPDDAGARSGFDDAYFTGGVVGGYDDYEADEALHRRNAALRLRDLERLRGRAGGRLLDVGCAFGYFLDEARARGWKVEGVEVSPRVAAVARDRFLVNVVPDLDEMARESPGAFDVVTVYQVLEHIADPAEALTLVRRCLVDGGTLVVETWDRRSTIARLMGSHWQEVAPPTVLWLWDRAALTNIMERAGFTVRDVRRSAKYVSARFAASLLDGRPGPLGAAGRFLARPGVRDRAVRYSLGDLVTFHARAGG